MSILQLLARENYITYHKTLAKLLGVDEAILFGELCSMHQFYGNNFFCEQSKLMNDTCLSEYRVRNALKNLQKASLVYVVKKGLPAKNYYILDEKRLIDILECRSTSSIKFDTTGDNNFNSTSDSKFNSTFNKNTNNKNTDNKNTDNIEREHARKTFGKYKNVYLSNDEYSQLKKEFPDGECELIIEKISEYQELHGKKYGNYFIAIQKWGNEDRKKAKQSNVHQNTSYNTDEEEMKKFWADVIAKESKQ